MAKTVSKIINISKSKIKEGSVDEHENLILTYSTDGKKSSINLLSSYNLEELKEELSDLLELLSKKMEKSDKDE